MKNPHGLAIDVTLVNSHHDRQQQEEHECHMGSTYRQEGFSIGHNYLRWEGETITRGKLLPSSVDVEETIGRGACSIVQRASWKSGGSLQRVALKHFPLGSKQRRGMLLKELRVLCTVECDCLVKLLGAFMEQDTVTMVLEYMDRGSLLGLLKSIPRATTKPSGPLISERLLLSVAFQILWGLSYLHFERMLHRDVKPANVLIHSNGLVKLSDFGIATEQHTDGVLNATVVGTTKYMSPERLRSTPYGTASDLWSFGLVLLECVGGRHPWEGINSMVELVLTVEETNTHDLIPAFVSARLREVLSGCLQQAPEKRIPAHILLASPWFSMNAMDDVDAASENVRAYFQQGDTETLLKVEGG